MEKTFEEKVVESTSQEELIQLKKWLFAENIRIQAEKEELQRLNQKLISERVQYQKETQTLNQKISAERQRLNQDMQFFDKKMEILQNGFRELEMDRKKFEREKRYEEERLKEAREEANGYTANVGVLFRGVRSSLALKKRYRDLLKIFHPDNLSGDHQMVVRINQEYERLKVILEKEKQA